jgi:hypothetical protein
MADTKISALTGATAADRANELAINEAGTSKKLTVGQVRDYEKWVLRCDSLRTLSNSGSEQAIFNVPANGRLTLPVGLYFFQSQFFLQSMSGTSGNFALDFLGAGTAVTAAWLYYNVGIDANDPKAIATQTGCFSTASQVNAVNTVTAATGTGAGVTSMGSFEVTTTGTLIPSITLVTAAAATVAIGSYLILERVSTATNLTSLGAAD